MLFSILVIESSAIIITNMPINFMHIDSASALTTSATTTSAAGIGDPIAILGQPFKLVINQAASFKQADFSLRFVNVTEDSRCPSGAQCIWAGQVSTLVEATKDSTGQSLGSFTLTLTAGGSSSLSSKTIVVDDNSYLVQLNSVQPYPSITYKIPSSATVATFIVTKAS